MRVLVYTGKGGVGKTSIAAATALHLSKLNKKTLIISTDQAHSLGDSFDISIGSSPTKITDYLDALEIDILDEGKRAWSNFSDYLKQIILDKSNHGIDAEEAILFPGLEEIFSLLCILRYYDESEYDVIVVDCATTGQSLSFLNYAERLRVLSDKLLPMIRNFNKALGSLISKKTSVPKPKDIVFDEFERLLKDLKRMQDILYDREITSIRIVMTPEKIVINEAVQNYTWLKLFDFGVDAVYVNKIYPKAALDGYFKEYEDYQHTNIELINSYFMKLKIFAIELQDIEIRGMAALDTIGNNIYCAMLPDEVFSLSKDFWIEEEHGTRTFVINLPFVRDDDIEVTKEDSDLIISLKNETRRFHLPANISRRKISKYYYLNDNLRIDMDY